MEKPKQKLEILPKDISQEFLNMETIDFLDFLRTQRSEPELSIIIDWQDVATARLLKAFLDDPRKPSKQKRAATIRATKEQHDQEQNVFASGVKWEKIEK